MGLFASVAAFGIGGLSRVPGLLGALFVSGAGAAFAGGAWARPRRIRGRQRHPELRIGSDWTHGPQPNPEGLDDRTRRALEVL